MPVYKDKTTNKWYYEFNYKTSTGETKRRKKRGFELKADAKEAEALEKIKLKDAPPSAMTLKQLYDLYVEAKTPEWLPGTKRKYTNAIELHILPYFTDVSIDKIDTKDIEDWKLKLYALRHSDGSKWAIKTLNRYRGDFSALFNYAIRHRILSFNPVTAVSSFKDPTVSEEDKEKQVWSPEEFKMFIDAVDDSFWHLFFTLLWCSGVRIGEAQGVMFKDVDFAKNTIKISKSIDTKQPGIPYAINPTKTKKTRILEMPAEFMNELKPYYTHQKKLDGWNEDRFLFGFEKPLANTTIDVKRTKYITLSGVKYISSHCFRHSHATYLLTMGIDIKSVSERLGHKDVNETLNTYAHVLPRNRDKILELLSSSLA